MVSIDAMYRLIPVVAPHVFHAIVLMFLPFFVAHTVSSGSSIASQFNFLFPVCNLSETFTTRVHQCKLGHPDAATSFRFCCIIGHTNTSHLIPIENN